MFNFLDCWFKLNSKGKGWALSHLSWNLLWHDNSKPCKCLIKMGKRLQRKKAPNSSEKLATYHAESPDWINYMSLKIRNWTRKYKMVSFLRLEKLLWAYLIQRFHLISKCWEIVCHLIESKFMQLQVFIYFQPLVREYVSKWKKYRKYG